MTTSKNSPSNIRKTCNCHPNRTCHHRERQQRRLYNMKDRRISSSSSSFLSSMKFIHIIIIVSVLLNIIINNNNVNGQQYNDNNDNDGSGYYYGDNNDNASPNDYYPPNGDGVGGSDTLYQDYYAKGGNDPYATGNVDMMGMGNDGNKVANNNWLMNTFGTAFVGGVGGWIVGSKYHCRKLEKKLFDKHKADQKLLYQNYYNDVYALQKQNSELIDALEQYIMVSNGSGSSSQQTKNTKRLS